MKVYVAARFYEKEIVLDTYKKLKKLGHIITADWTPHKNIKPYSKNPDIAKDYAIEDIAGVKDCDVFILILGDQAGTGTSSELGAAIMSQLLNKKPKIYVVGEYLDQNFCFYHPSVIRRKTIQHVLKELA